MITDKDAQRRIWCMFGDNNLGMVEEIARLVYVGEDTCYSEDGPIWVKLYTTHTGTRYTHCRECTPEELAEHGLTQPPRPWADRVTQWAKDRNIIGGTTAKDQFGKLLEEVDELREAIDRNNLLNIADAIGDCSVVLDVIAEQYGLTLEQCQEAAWEQIKDRKGRIENGVFKKEATE